MSRPWTLPETLFIKKWAGTTLLSKLAKDIKRDIRDVAQECARLGVPIIYVGTPLFWCDNCSNWCVTLRKSGRCNYCEKSHQIEVIETRIAVLLSCLTPTERELYGVTEAQRSGIKQTDKPKNTCYRTTCEREKVAAMSVYYASLDKWRTQQIHRKLRATQKRKERIQTKVIKTMLSKNAYLDLCLCLACANL